MKQIDPPVRKTLERVLSRAGAASRAEARSWIGTGRVRVNGKLIQTPDVWVDPEKDRVTIDGRPLRPAAKVYLLLYKPTGYVTTRRDPDGRPTVYDLVRDADAWMVPVGRLDLETSGLLVMTNDTAFAEQLTNPDWHVPKTYQVKCASLLDDAQIERLRDGLVLQDGPARPARVARLRDGARHTFLEITLTEGRNRQVRRMIEGVGSRVLKLVRTAVGPVRIGDLRIGTFRHLTADEVAELRPKKLRTAGVGDPWHKRKKRNAGSG